MRNSFDDRHLGELRSALLPRAEAGSIQRVWQITAHGGFVLGGREASLRLLHHQVVVTQTEQEARELCRSEGIRALMLLAPVELSDDDELIALNVQVAVAKLGGFSLASTDEE